MRLRITFVVIMLTAFTACASRGDLTLSGTIESTQIDINSEVSGKLISVLKEEGAYVDAGETVAVVDSSAAALQVKQAEAVLKSAEAKLDELKSGSRGEQIKQAQASVKAAKARLDELRAGARSEEITQAEAALKQAEEAFESAKKNYDYRMQMLNNMKQLYDAGGVSKQQVDDAQNLVDTSTQQLKNSEEQVTIAKSRLVLLREGPTAESVKAAEANYEQALAQLELLKNGATIQAVKAAESAVEQAKAAYDQAMLSLSKHNIASPVKGTLLYKNVNVGDIVMPGTSIGTVSDLSELWIKVFIPQKNINAVKLGQEVIVRTISLPKVRIRGKITFISSEAEFTPKNIETTEAKENTVFKVKIKILDNVDKLRPGMTADVHIPIN